jgi:hypothetical protein
MGIMPITPFLGDQKFDPKTSAVLLFESGT